ncbi:uncharacterized protein LOC126902973 [Daktulosphaira vitifoliae]|uniref:uncharacterized protein LOC126902973 n=1 Tax=Daktulosphaira vitifoliae TaxID=58002 RepID=UPI0021A9E8C4|nr:uncharacterized protein LOC126902973 [Daktulosphaira vitifoliae]
MPYIDRSSVIHLKIMKKIGLYQYLNPNSYTIFGYPLLQFFALIEIAVIIFVLIMSIWSLLNCVNDLSATVKFSMCCFGTLNIGVKMYYMYGMSDKVNACMQFTCINYMKFKGHKKNLLIKGRRKIEYIINIIALYWSIAVFFWILSPVLFTKRTVIINLNGQLQSYKYNIFNLIFLKSDKLYNKYYDIFWLIESFMMVVWCHVTIMHGVIFASTCVTINYQLKTITFSYSQLGNINKKNKNIENGFDKANINTLIEEEAINNHKLIIKDQTRILRFIREAYAIFRPIAFTQLCLDSSLFISIIFIVIVNVAKGQSILTFENTLFTISALAILINLLVACILLQMISDEKDGINFALYSCNWTSMNMKFKKILLLSMCVNNAEKTRINITHQKSMNVELFGGVLQRTYTILSVLIKWVF